MSRKKVTELAEPEQLPLKNFLEHNRKKFNQSTLAYQLGVTREFLCEVLAGTKPVPRDKGWPEKIVTAYGLSLGEARRLLGLPEGSE
jgi:hypothetical protein